MTPEIIYGCLIAANVCSLIGLYLGWERAVHWRSQFVEMEDRLHRLAESINYTGLAEELIKRLEGIADERGRSTN